MTAASAGQVAVRRFSIHDRQLAVVGYELAGDVPGRPTHGGDTAVRAPEAIVEALSAGGQRSIDQKRLFLAADRMTLLDADWLMLLPPRSVLILGTEVAEDREVLSRSRGLAEAGYALALEDDERHAWTDEFLSIAAFLNFDGATTPVEEARRLVAHCRRHDVRLLARNVHVRQQLGPLLDCGVDLFQGAAVETPSVVSTRPGAAVDPDRLRTSAKLLGEPWDFTDLEELLRADPGMTLQVLHLASVGRAGETRRTVRNLREALVLAGAWRIQTWIAFLLATPESELPAEAVIAALARARACEIIAPAVGESARTAFAAGMISAFDSLMDVTTAQVADRLALSDELREAAFGRTTPLARLVRDVTDHQRGTVTPDAASHLPTAQLDAALASALHWAWDATSGLT